MLATETVATPVRPRLAVRETTTTGNGMTERGGDSLGLRVLRRSLLFAVAACLVLRKFGVELHRLALANAEDRSRLLRERERRIVREPRDFASPVGEDDLRLG